MNKYAIVFGTEPFTQAPASLLPAAREHHVSTPLSTNTHCPRHTSPAQTVANLSLAVLSIPQKAKYLFLKKELTMEDGVWAACNACGCGHHPGDSLLPGSQSCLVISATTHPDTHTLESCQTNSFIQHIGGCPEARKFALCPLLFWELGLCPGILLAKPLNFSFTLVSSLQRTPPHTHTECLHPWKSRTLNKQQGEAGG